MKIKLIGLGQCGSFVVYDVIAVLFNQKPSKAIRAAPQIQWKRDVNRAISRMLAGGAQLRMRIKRYFGGLKTADIPKFLVIDGNLKNPIVDGLQGEEISRKLGPLQIFVQSLALSKRNNGCNLGQVGEYVFHRDKADRKSQVFNELKFSEPVEINALVFAGGGGSGSGGAPVLNEEPHKDSLLINMMVLPPYHISDQRQKWNTGRCIMRLAEIHKQTTLLLFSNLSESLNDQFNVNKYIRELVVRLANFGYPGNIPKVATDIDRKDLQVFFSGKPAFVGMSSLNRDEPNKVDIENMVEQALSLRQDQDADRPSDAEAYGLSIEYPESGEAELFKRIKTVMIVIGLTPRYIGRVNIVDIIKDKLAAQLGTQLCNLDCRVYSYTSLNKVELTIFFRHNNYRSSFLLKYFLDSYLKWHDRNCKETEGDYLAQKVDDKAENDFIEEVQMALKEEIDDKEIEKLEDPQKFEEWLRNTFTHPIIEVT